MTDTEVDATAACGQGTQEGGDFSGACFCETLDEAQLAGALTHELDDLGISRRVLSSWATAFARWPVFISLADWQRMTQVVGAIEKVVSLPAWHEEALRLAPAIASHSPQGAASVFFGYDFHVSGSRMGLIEINTNAGGALVNTLLARAQRKCCRSIQRLQPGAAEAAAFETAIVGMFRSEWRLAKRTRPLRCIAIVDDSPEQQYLYPEFLLMQRLLARHGIRALISDPSQLAWIDGVLRYGDETVDLVYNRLTDFYLESARSAALKEAYLQDAIVLTPHPQAHALYADKRRLITLSDDAALQRLGTPEHVRSVLRQAIPATTLVTVRDADALWERRRNLFFKPFAGFGSRAAYRGDKLTKRVWQEILAGGYVAQEIVAPGTRVTAAPETGTAMKFDLRLYAYAGHVQWTAARLYQGQTTNFRTPGGGFAPVYTLAAGETARCGSEARDGHASFVFLIDSIGAVHPLPHSLYVALARGEAASPALAGQTFRAADWYVRMEGSNPKEVVNEWYGWVQFDTTGHLDPTGEPPLTERAASGPSNVDSSAFPTEKERASMHSALFGA
ncbi:hypothetical protein WG902_20385 [Ramlibacter sp. PS3R-8]|uniref:hypothetical protein n=1 Tax=Ramlibacter sp. PS3R-8 TaxID=3133437 RepID=UPI0030B1EAA6